VNDRDDLVFDRDEIAPCVSGHEAQATTPSTRNEYGYAVMAGHGAPHVRTRRTSRRPHTRAPGDSVPRERRTITARARSTSRSTRLPRARDSRCLATHAHAPRKFRVHPHHRVQGMEPASSLHGRGARVRSELFHLVSTPIHHSP